jgi:predicted outer membrane protein
MRLVPTLAAFALIALPALAQTSSPTATQPTAAVKASTDTTQHHRLTADERFAKANTTHDGHLTLAQAKAGYPTVARHFAEIDAAKKGFVTEDQIRAWEKAEREHHHDGQQASVPPAKG